MSQKSTNSTMSAWRPDQPYNALPALPPAAELGSRVVLK